MSNKQSKLVSLSEFHNDRLVLLGANDLTIKNPITAVLKTDIGAYQVLSTYNDDIWYLPDNWFTNSTPSNKKVLNFNFIHTGWREAIKIFMARKIYSDDYSANLSGSTYVSFLVCLISITNRLTKLGVTMPSNMNAIKGHQLLNELRKSELSINYVYSLVGKFEALWQCLKDTKFTFPHPWGGTNYQALVTFEKTMKPKTEIIPDVELAVLFNDAESDIKESNQLLNLLDNVDTELKPHMHLNSATVSERRQKVLKKYGCSEQYLNLVLRKRNTLISSIIIVLATTGMRVHELLNIKRDGWRSEIKEGERFFYIQSCSDKTYEGYAEWLAPKIAINALKVAQRITKSLQNMACEELEAVKKTDDYKRGKHLKSIKDLVFLTRQENVASISVSGVRAKVAKRCETLGIQAISPHQFRRTFANYVIHSKLGDLRYLRDHFKHWSLDMTALYADNEKLDIELMDLLYSEFDNEKKNLISHWLDPDTRLSGGLAERLTNLRNEEINKYNSRTEMVESLAKLVNIRATGIAWCTNERNGCGGGRCEECVHGVIDDKQQYQWEAIFEQQLELIPLIDDCGESGQIAIRTSIDRCKKVLTDLGADIKALEEKQFNAK